MFFCCFVNLRDLWEVLAVMISDLLVILVLVALCGFPFVLPPAKSSMGVSGKVFVVAHGA